MKRLMLLIFLVGIGCPVMAGTASVLLGWDADTLDANGNPLTDLAGYTVYQSTHDFKVAGVWISTTTAQADSSISKINVSSSTILETVPGLSNNVVYYFRLTAFDTVGLVSAFNKDSLGNDSEVIFRLNVYPAPPRNLTVR